jgi:hypothetical protein
MITQRQKEILLYIYNNGMTDVIVTPRIMRQNDNLYQRIWKLEVANLITVKRRIGMSSLNSLTNEGINFIRNNFIVSE